MFVFVFKEAGKTQNVKQMPYVADADIIQQVYGDLISNVVS